MIKIKQKPRIPSPIDVRADLHGLKIFLMDYKSTSVDRIHAKYKSILAKAKKQGRMRRSFQHANIDQRTLKIIINDGLEEFFNPKHLKPIL